MKLIYFSTILTLSYFNLSAQVKSASLLNSPKFELNIGGGMTYGFNQFEVEEPSSPDFNSIMRLKHNLGIGLKIYHKNRWFTSLDLWQYTPAYGVYLFRENTDDNSFIGSGRYSVSSFSFISTSIRIGKITYLNNPRWQLSWLGGINLEYVNTSNSGNINSVNSPAFALYENDPTVETGIAPSIQAGYQIAHRGRRMGVSFTLISNLGLKYYARKEYEAWLNNQQFFARINTKGDFIAAVLKYEMYFGKLKK